ncbi:MAG: hypothetical protein JEY94_17515 [Melioribacteraceae bacterium]|nr:hypothetical protein [Melioribacteraceae bacterium]
MRRLFTILFLFALSTSMFAQIAISGDARVRPRMDVIDGGDFENSKTDFYYMYWAKLNLKATIGDGWFFNTQLGHNGYGAFGFTNGLTKNVGGSNTLANQIEGATRPSLDFLQLYLGVAKQNWGISGGLIPLGAVANPVYDVHYYSHKMIDVPFYIYNIDAAFGFKGYLKLGSGQLNVLLLADVNEYSQEDKTGKELYNENDGNTLGLDYEVQLGEFKIQPTVLFSYGRDSIKTPMTYGLNFTAPKAGNFTFSGSAFMSNQSNDGTTEYDAWYFRLKAVGKVGPGTAVVWYDMAKRTDKYGGVIGDIETDFSYIWAMYKIPVYSGEHGTVDIMPTIRYAMESVDNVKDYSRAKIEITTHVTFK